MTESNSRESNTATGIAGHPFILIALTVVATFVAVGLVVLDLSYRCPECGRIVQKLESRSAFYGSGTLGAPSKYSTVFLVCEQCSPPTKVPSDALARTAFYARRHYPTTIILLLGAALWIYTAKTFVRYLTQLSAEDQKRKRMLLCIFALGGCVLLWIIGRFIH